jgi:hypothetical protein
MHLAEEFEWLSNQFFAKPPTYASAYYGTDKQWKGLARYRNDIEADVGPSDPQLEYAKVTTVLEARKVDLVYYSDVAGKICCGRSYCDADSALLHLNAQVSYLIRTIIPILHLAPAKPPILKSTMSEMVTFPRSGVSNSWCTRRGWCTVLGTIGNGEYVRHRR